MATPPISTNFSCERRFFRRHKKIFTKLCSPHKPPPFAGRAAKQCLGCAAPCGTRVLAQGFVDLKLCQGSVDGVLESESYKKIYMHRTGHWLGMDVHDVGDYKMADNWRALEPGMVLTVEPGAIFRPPMMCPPRFGTSVSHRR